MVFLKNTHPRTPCLYILPKIHKHPTNPPGRPIVSSIGSLLENTSRYVNFLAPHVQTLTSYCRDSKDFLMKIQNIPWESSYLLITLDVA